MTNVKQYLCSKRMFYTLCFVLLGMIDFVRHTQQEQWWGPAVNCTGILLMMIVLSEYERKEIMCLFTYIWSGISAVLLIISAMWQNVYLFGIYKWTIFFALLNIWLIGIPLYQIAKNIFIKKTVQIKWNAVIILVVAMVCCMMLSPYHAVWPVWFLVIFGMFYLTRFQEENFKDLREAMTDGIMIAFVLLQLYAYGYRPFDAPRYVGAFSNSNMTALHYLVTYVAVLFKLHFLVTNESSKKWRIVFFVGAAGLLDFQILTMTRTAWVISAVITFLFGILVVKNLWKKSGKAILLRGMTLGICAIVLFPVVFATVRWLPPLRHHPIWYEGEWGENKVHSFDPPNSEKYTDFDEFMGTILERLKIISSIRNPLVLKAQAAEDIEYRPVSLSGPENLTPSLRIRLTIYKAYLQDLNWTGHGKQEGHYIIPEIDTFVWHPQNLWIQVAYYYGIPAGILFSILSVLLFGKQIGAVVKHGENQYAFIPLLISIVFFLYGMTELVWTIGQMILFLFLFIQHPQFGPTKKLQ